MTGSASTEDEVWLGSHIFYHGDLDDLIGEMVAPLVEELRSERLCDEYFFLRYWDGGPHVRLRVRCAPWNRATVRALVGDHARAFFANRPHGPGLDPANYRASARLLAAREGTVAMFADPLPSGTVLRIPYRPEHRRYTPALPMRLVERHFHRSSDIMIDVVRRRPATPARVSLAMALYLIMWHRYRRSFPGLKDRLEALPPHRPPVSDWRSAVERISGQARMLAALPERSHEDGSLVAWAREAGSLVESLRPDGSEVEVLNSVVHMACNRIGLPPYLESAVYAGAREQIITGEVG